MKNKKGRSTVFKCVICGKFISYNDIGTDNIVCEYIPDTEYILEITEFTQKKCIKTFNKH